MDPRTAHETRSSHGYIQISTTENPMCRVQVLDRTMHKIQKQNSNLTNEDHR